MNLSYIVHIQGYGANLSGNDVPSGYYTLKEYCKTTGISKQKIRYALNMDRVEEEYYIKQGFTYFIRKDYVYVPPTVDVPDGYLGMKDYCEKYDLQRHIVYYALYHHYIDPDYYVKYGRNYYIREDFDYRKARMNVPEGYLNVADYCLKHGRKRSSVYYFLRIERIPRNQFIRYHKNYYIKADYIF